MGQGERSDPLHITKGRFFCYTRLICDTFSGLAAHLSRIAAAVATTSDETLQNSCLSAKIAITLH